MSPRLTTEAAKRLGWSIQRRPDGTAWVATYYGRVLIEPTCQRLLRAIARFEQSRLAPGS